MVKKGVLGAALTAGALYLAFGTSAPSYVRTAFHKVRHSAHDAVPVQFDIDRVREEVASLEGPIKDNLESFYRTQFEVEILDREIGTFQANMETEKKAIIALRETVTAGGVHKVGHVTYTTEEVKGELARRLDHYRSANKILQDKKDAIKAKRQIMDTTKQALVNMGAQKKEMMTRLEGIEARLKLIDAKRQSSEFTVDDGGPVARVRQSVTDLEKRIEVQARMAENGDFSTANGSVFIEPGRDVVKEVDAEFGGSSDCTDAKNPGKSL
jgi:hypothetical protein